MKQLPPILKEKIAERTGAWLWDEQSYQRYVKKVCQYNYKIMTGQINHNNSYLGYIFNILLYYQFGKRYMDTDEKFVQFIQLRAIFHECPYKTVMELYNFYSSKGAIPFDVHAEIQETLQWLIEPYERSYDEYDKLHAGQYWRQGKDWINKYYSKIE